MAPIINHGARLGADAQPVDSPRGKAADDRFEAVDEWREPPFPYGLSGP
jgi:hypothetical protein